MRAAAARYQEEGVSRIYLACAGSNTQRLINILEDTFGEVDEPDLEDLETQVVTQKREQAADAEEEDVVVTGGTIPKGGTTQVMITQLPVVMEFGLQPDMYPISDPIREKSKKDPSKKTTKFYYTCRKCNKTSQNKISMFTHARRCFNIVLICPGCQKSYESHDGANKHINEVHGGSCEVVEGESSEMIAE